MSLAYVLCAVGAGLGGGRGCWGGVRGSWGGPLSFSFL